MKYVVETGKSVDQAAADFLEAVNKYRFGVLHIHNLQETMKKKGVDIADQCRIFEICNPRKAKKVLEEDMEMNMALPCRVSIYTDGGKTKIGMIKPTALLAFLSKSEALKNVAQEVEENIIRMIDEAR